VDRCLCTSTLTLGRWSCSLLPQGGPAKRLPAWLRPFRDLVEVKMCSEESVGSSAVLIVCLLATTSRISACTYNLEVEFMAMFTYAGCLCGVQHTAESHKQRHSQMAEFWYLFYSFCCNTPLEACKSRVSPIARPWTSKGWI